MRRVYIITGANGHLGGALVRALAGEPAEVRGLILPGEAAEDHGNVRYYRGDVCQPETLRPLFEGLDGAEIRVIHTAGIVDISGEVTLKDLRRKRDRHAQRRGAVPRVRRASGLRQLRARHSGGPRAAGCSRKSTPSRPTRVVGGYAKTKAEATQLVLDAARAGLDAVVVHTVGHTGGRSRPRATTWCRWCRNTCAAGCRPASSAATISSTCRDVAQGCLLAAEKGRRGECYILSNRRYEIRDLLRMIRSICGGRRLPVLPMWVARAATPVLQAWRSCARERPLYTPLFPLCALQQQQFQPRQGDDGAGLPPARPVSRR